MEYIKKPIIIEKEKLLKIYEDRYLELQKLKHLKDNKGIEDRQLGVNYCINVLKEMPPATLQESVLDNIKSEICNQEQQILDAVKCALEVHIKDRPRMVDILMRQIEHEIETVLYDNCNECKEEIEREEGINMTNLEWLKDNCVDLLEEIIVPHLDEWLFEHKNIPFKNEDILQNDIAKHIILEWIKQDDVFLKNILGNDLALKNGYPVKCNIDTCEGCDFHEHCGTKPVKEWLEAEYKPMYKKGDILITKDGEVIIVSEGDNINSVIASHNIRYAERGSGFYVQFYEIERKIGNFYD